MNRLSKLTLLLASLSYASWGQAYQPDAAQVKLAEKHAGQWLTEDREIDSKLAQLKEENGPPNVIFVLSDDIGWGELGSYGGGKLRGTPTPNLDQLAADGMRFLQHYSEPSCTVTRAALMTGRLPVRSGVDGVLFPGRTEGLVDEEVTLAEVLSRKGYRTAMFGKWHLGEMPEHQPTNQGFDYAFYTLFNGGAWPWMDNAEHYDSSNEVIGDIPYSLDVPQDYEARYGIQIHGIQESYKGKEPREVAKLSLARYNVHDDELTDKILDFIGDSPKDDKPFFVYFATNANQVFACPPKERNQKYVDSSNCQAAQLAQHDNNMKRIRTKLEEMQIAENTLLVWASDNGPMYGFFPSAGFTYLRGAKHSVNEGGVRTPAIAWWPGMIEAGSDPLDLVHVTDWYTTIARIADATKYIPGRRIIDGVDQTSLLLNGEDHSRRDYLFHYRYSLFGKGSTSLGAVRHGELKFFPDTLEVYNIIRDPREKFQNRRQYLWLMEPMREMVKEHQEMMEKYPNRIQ